MNSDSLYPEHDKLEQVADESRIIGEFLDTFLLRNYVLGEYGNGRYTDTETLYPVRTDVQELLADYFGIDLVKLDIEKNQMLDAWRKENNA